MQAIKSFTEFMASNYEVDELADIAAHGCSGGVNGMIYYDETTAIYNEFADDLHSIVGEFKDETGMLPIYITEHLDNARMFRNAMVWFCAELVAGQAILNRLEI
jgi:hypothetical protein